jgi:hypothetical protein
VSWVKTVPRVVLLMRWAFRLEVRRGNTSVLRVHGPSATESAWPFIKMLKISNSLVTLRSTRYSNLVKTLRGQESIAVRAVAMR